MTCYSPPCSLLTHAAQRAGQEGAQHAPLAHQLRALLAGLLQRLPRALQTLQRRPRADREPEDWPDRTDAAFQSWLLYGGDRCMARWLPALRAASYGLTDRPGGPDPDPSPDPFRACDALLPDGPATSAVITASLARMRFAPHMPAQDVALVVGEAGVSPSSGVDAADPGSVADSTAPRSASERTACAEGTGATAAREAGLSSAEQDGLRPAASCLAWLRMHAPTALPSAAPAAALRAACFGPPAAGARHDWGPAASAAMGSEPGAKQSGAEAPAEARLGARADRSPTPHPDPDAAPAEPPALQAAREAGAGLGGGHGPALTPAPGAGLQAEEGAAAAPAAGRWMVTFPEFVEALARCLARPSPCLPAPAQQLQLEVHARMGCMC